MKYYHLISGSMMLFGVQYLLQNVLQIPLAAWVRILFFILQFIIFIAYALLLCVLLFASKRQKRTFKQQPKQPHTPANMQKIISLNKLPKA